MEIKSPMNRLQKALGIGALVGATFLSGCRKGPGDIYVEGTVKKEAGSATQIVDSSGALFGNDSVKLSEPTYSLQIETSEGVYTASVVQWGDRISIETLALAIEEGSRVRFAKTYNGNDRFREDRIGKIYSDELTVLGKQ